MTQRQNTDDSYDTEQYHGHAPVYGLMLLPDGSTFVKPDGTPLPALSRWCYTVMKSFGPKFMASRSAVARRMGVSDVDTVSKCQADLESVSLLEKTNTPGKGEPQKWRILEAKPNTKSNRFNRLLDKNEVTDNIGGGNRFNRYEVTDIIGTEALNEAFKETSKDLNATKDQEQTRKKDPIQVAPKVSEFELKVALANHYPSFDPRSGLYSRTHPDTRIRQQAAWEAKAGHPYIPVPDWNEAAFVADWLRVEAKRA